MIKKLLQKTVTNSFRPVAFKASLIMPMAQVRYFSPAAAQVNLQTHLNQFMMDEQDPTVETVFSRMETLTSQDWSSELFMDYMILVDEIQLQAQDVVDDKATVTADNAL